MRSLNIREAIGGWVVEIYTPSDDPASVSGKSEVRVFHSLSGMCDWLNNNLKGE